MKIDSLRAKWMLLFFAFFFIPFFVLIFFSVSMSKGMMRQSTFSHLQNLVDVKAMAIEQWLKETVGDGKTISESQEIKSLAPAKVEPYFNMVKHFYQAYLDISIADLKQKKPSRSPSFEAEEWFQKAVEKGAFVSKPFRDTSLNKPTIIISVLISAMTGRFEEFPINSNFSPEVKTEVRS